MSDLKTNTLMLPRLDVLSREIDVDLFSYPGGRTQLEREIISLIVAEAETFDQWGCELLSQLVNTTNRTNVMRLREDAIPPIVAGGLGILSDENLTQLAKNYFALAVLRDAVRLAEQLPDYWLHAFSDNIDQEIPARTAADHQAAEMAGHHSMGKRTDGLNQQSKRERGVRSRWRAAAAKIAAVLLVACCVVGFVAVRNRNAELERQLSDRIKELKSVVTVDGFCFRKTSPNRVGFGGSFDPIYIDQIRFRWGTESSESEFSVLAASDMRIDAQSGRVRFYKESPDLPLKGDTIVPMLQFVPKPEMPERYPDFFTPERLAYSRSFYLGRDGIEADVQFVTVGEPHDGIKVSYQEAVEGQLKLKGAWPVVFVRPLDAGQGWWVQDPCDVSDSGAFTCGVRYGDGSTPPGTRYSVVVMVMRSKAEAERFRPGQQLTSLPSGYPKSHSITVSRQ